MPAGHAPQGVVGVGGPAPARQGARGEAVQDVAGMYDQVVPGAPVRSPGVGQGVAHTSPGVDSARGGHALLVRNGPEGVCQPDLVGPEAVGGAYGIGRRMVRGEDLRGPEQGIVTVGDRRDAVFRCRIGQDAVVVRRRLIYRSEQAIGPRSVSPDCERFSVTLVSHVCRQCLRLEVRNPRYLLPSLENTTDRARSVPVNGSALHHWIQQLMQRKLTPACFP